MSRTPGSVVPAELTQFKVVGLHDRQTMDVHITDNKLILVGENGTGKSTFTNLIYYFLTRQWQRLQAYRFEAIEAVLGGQKLTVTQEHLGAYFEARQHERIALRRFPHHIAQELLTRTADPLFLEHLEQDQDLLDRFSEDFRIPPRMLQDLISDLKKELGGKPTKLHLMEREISSLAQGQFLYLPTYRRIEQDLRSIFRGADIAAEIRKFRERFPHRKGAPFIELVEFGMEDVEQTIASRMTHIKESVRNGLDNLTGTYLRDVIRGVHTAVNVSRVQEIDPSVLDAVFARIDEATLPTSDKARLKKKVATITAAGEISDSEDKVIAHFLLKLIDLYTEQQANERNIREFARLCNQYLTGKQILYDNTKYTISVGSTSNEGSSAEALEMRMLSSGEKQIVSLFSHLYLSGETTFFVIIDEPELSLSVPWQRTFLPDIANSGMCSGLVAVTHSPFVWENELETYVRSIAEFTKPHR